jgi:hypothetical protein
MKHKHYDCIIAWANGAEIQQRDCLTGGWFTCDPNLIDWDEYTEYRLKPNDSKPVVRWMWMRRVDATMGAWLVDSHLFTEDEANNFLGKNVQKFKLEWSRVEMAE